jgi:hypothetical protein
MAPSKYPGLRVEIRLPSEEEKKKLDEVAKARGVTTSKYILYAIDLASQPPRPAQGQDLKHLQEDNRNLAGELHQTRMRASQLEGELRKLQNAEILKEEGSGPIDPELLRIIRDGPPMHDYRLLALLGSEPGDEASRGIARQLQILEATGFISRTTKGWAWKG